MNSWFMNLVNSYLEIPSQKFSETQHHRTAVGILKLDLKSIASVAISLLF